MNRRLRFLAGILTLAALTVSFAETVWGSVCAPTAPDSMAMGEMSMSAPDGASDCLLMAHQHEAGDSEGPHCPLNPVVGAGCSAVATHPSSSPRGDQEPVAVVSATPSSDLDAGVLLPRALFRPPRA